MIADHGAAEFLDVIRSLLESEQSNVSTTNYVLPTFEQISADSLFGGQVVNETGRVLHHRRNAHHAGRSLGLLGAGAGPSTLPGNQHPGKETPVEIGQCDEPNLPR